VIKISYDQNNVVIKTANDIIYTAQKVIVTVPLGVLKKNMIKFSPDLDSKK